MSKKSKIIMAAVTIVLAIFLLLVLGNSHIEIFPGVVREYDYFLEMDVTSQEMISLLDFRRGGAFTFMGWVVLVLVGLGLPLLAGYFAGKKFGK